MNMVISSAPVHPVDALIFQLVTLSESNGAAIAPGTIETLAEYRQHCDEPVPDGSLFVNEEGQVAVVPDKL